jgi:TM2 domain-containing membrane protein YozV
MTDTIEQKSEKTFVATVLLCLLLGIFGVHRFYTGKIGTGILMLLTFGGLTIWTWIDLIVIICGKFKDKKGLPIKN